MATQIIKDFNTLFCSVLQQMAPMIGNKYYLLYSNLIKFNATIGVENFYYYSKPHGEQILNKNEHFFLDEENLSDLTQGEHHNNSDLMTIIGELKSVWSKLDTNSKENLWALIQGLYTLAQQYGQIKGL